MEDERVEKIGEVDYAILKSVNYLRNLNIRDLGEEIREITKILNIRAIIIEKHIFALIKHEFISINEHCIVTQKGEDAIYEFERNNGEWNNIDNFIIAQIKNRKERDLKFYKITDKFLLVLIVVCIVYIIYIGFL